MSPLGRRSRDEPPSLDDEREALRRGLADVDELKRTLLDRADAVRQREQELSEAIARASAGAPAQGTATRSVDADTVVISAASADVARRAAELDKREADLRRREVAHAEAEQTVVIAAEDATRERELLAREDELKARESEVVRREAAVRSQQGVRVDEASVVELEQRVADLERREDELERRAAALTEREATLRPAPPSGAGDAEQLQHLDRRLAELNDAERQFLRTQRELTERSEALAERERRIEERENALADRADDGGWSRVDLSELEQRLLKLERRQDTAGGGFADGLRRLQRDRGPRPATEA